MGSKLLVLHVREQRPHARRYQALLDELNAAALGAVAGAGWDPQLVATAHADRVEVLTRARAADAVLIMGGEDVDPVLYGGDTEYPGSGTHEPRSDRTLVAVILDAVRRGAPLLGVCRGHQLLNVALGGTLHEDMRGHRAVGRDSFVRTRLAPVGDAALPFVGEVRCSHHQAVRDLGKGLRVVARADDGVIEAIRHDVAPVMGVQWHPEHPDVAAAELPALLEKVAGGVAVPVG